MVIPRSYGQPALGGRRGLAHISTNKLIHQSQHRHAPSPRGRPINCLCRVPHQLLSSQHLSSAQQRQQQQQDLPELAFSVKADTSFLHRLVNTAAVQNRLQDLTESLSDRLELASQTLTWRLADILQGVPTTHAVPSGAQNTDAVTLDAGSMHGFAVTAVSNSAPTDQRSMTGSGRAVAAQSGKSTAVASAQQARAQTIRAARIETASGGPADASLPPPSRQAHLSHAWGHTQARSTVPTTLPEPQRSEAVPYGTGTDSGTYDGATCASGLAVLNLSAASEQRGASPRHASQTVEATFAAGSTRHARQSPQSAGWVSPLHVALVVVALCSLGVPALWRRFQEDRKRARAMRQLLEMNAQSLGAQKQRFKRALSFEHDGQEAATVDFMVPTSRTSMTSAAAPRGAAPPRSDHPLQKEWERFMQASQVSEASSAADEGGPPRLSKARIAELDAKRRAMRAARKAPGGGLSLLSASAVAETLAAAPPAAKPIVTHEELYSDAGGSGGDDLAAMRARAAARTAHRRTLGIKEEYSEDAIAEVESGYRGGVGPTRRSSGEWASAAAAAAGGAAPAWRARAALAPSGEEPTTVEGSRSGKPRRAMMRAEDVDLAVSLRVRGGLSGKLTPDETASTSSVDADSEATHHSETMSRLAGRGRGGDSGASTSARGNERVGVTGDERASASSAQRRVDEPPTFASRHDTAGGTAAAKALPPPLLPVTRRQLVRPSTGSPLGAAVAGSSSHDDAASVAHADARQWGGAAARARSMMVGGRGASTTPDTTMSVVEAEGPLRWGDDTRPGTQPLTARAVPAICDDKEEECVSPTGSNRLEAAMARDGDEVVAVVLPPHRGPANTTSGRSRVAGGSTEGGAVGSTVGSGGWASQPGPGTSVPDALTRLMRRPGSSSSNPWQQLNH